MKKVLLLLLIVSMMAPAAFAGAIRNNAGCGLGTLLFESVGKPNGGWLLQMTASWTNSTLSNTFSMTTGTINCQGHINKVVSNEVYEFVTANMDNLAKDIAMGHGDTINSLSTMLAVKDVDAFASRLQSNFGEIFPNSDVQSDSVANKIVALS
ncbi:MAG: DUF3015 domain-containing protein [Mucispirillum sp.]|nr:DUF3015 domain-containing protein [Mucispirillum sp.]